MKILNKDINLAIVYFEFKTQKKVIVCRNNLGIVFPYFDEDFTASIKDDLGLKLSNKEFPLVDEFIYTFDYNEAKISKEKFYKNYGYDVIVFHVRCFSCKLEHSELIVFNKEKYFSCDFISINDAYKILYNEPLKIALTKALNYKGEIVLDFDRKNLQ